MSQSTPIFNIPRDGYQQNDQQSRAIQNLIDDNVDEMQQVSVDQAYQMQQMQQMQPQPMPTADFSSSQFQGQQPQFQGQQNLPQFQMQQIVPQNQFNQPQMLNTNLYVPSQMRGQLDSSNMHPLQHNTDDWYSYLLREFKDSIIIAVLFVVLNISIVQRLLQMYVPYMDNVYLELIVRGIISGTLFYFLKRFWRP